MKSGGIVVILLLSTSYGYPYQIDPTKGKPAGDSVYKTLLQEAAEVLDVSEGFVMSDRLDSGVLLISPMRHLCLYPSPKSGEGVSNWMYLISLDLKYRTKLRCPAGEGRPVAVSPDQTRLATVGGFFPLDANLDRQASGQIERVEASVVSLVDGRALKRWDRLKGTYGQDMYIEGRPIYWLPDRKGLLVPRRDVEAGSKKPATEVSFWDLESGDRDAIFSSTSEKLLVDYRPSPDGARFLDVPGGQKAEMRRF